MKNRNRLHAMVVASIAFAGAAAAEEVTLSTPDGAIAIVGKIVDVQGGMYLVRTAIGALEIDPTMVTCAGDTCPTTETGTRRVLVEARIGSVVTLSSGASVQVSGRLLGFENQVYRVETKLGSLNVPATSAACTGAGCPRWVNVPASHLTTALQGQTSLASDALRNRP
ncbi:MAG: hypothetical protein AAF281_08825 [Pseudomonadota bacterium]